MMNTTPHTPARVQNRPQILELSRTLMMRIQNDGQTRWCTNCRYDIDRRIAANHRRAGHHIEA